VFGYAVSAPFEMLPLPGAFNQRQWSIRLLRHGSDKDSSNHEGNANIKLPYRTQCQACGDAGNGQKFSDGIYCCGSLHKPVAPDKHLY